MKLRSNFTKDTSWERVLILIAAAEFVIMLLSKVSFSGLAGASFFDFGVDIFFGFVFSTAAPQFIVEQPWVGIGLDALYLALMMLLYRNPKANKIAIALFILSFLYYVTLMGFLTHRNYHAGLFLIWIPFLFKNSESRILAYEATRYYLLFFYFSAGLLKILHGALGEVNSLSANLINQFKPYFLEGNTGIRTQTNLFLINHPSFSYTFLLLATIVELVCVLGFITRRWDRWLGLLLLIFHFCNWYIMDIAPIGQLAFICLFFAGRAFLTSKFSGSVEPV